MDTEKAKQEIHEELDRFLTDIRVSAGGYAPVEEDDMQDLYRIFRAIINTKWTPDPDGDRPVQLILLNLAMYEPMFYEPIIRDGEASPNQRLMQMLSNLSSAVDDVKMWYKIEQHMRVYDGR